jgi:transcriptional regulator with GAF, ATPase, and Fis domain
MKSEAPPPEETLIQESFALSSSRATRSIAELQWTDAEGDHTRKVEATVIAGTAASNGVVVADRLVSRLHAELDLRDDGLWVRDLGSTNGTYVDGIRVAGARVPDGSRITLGGTSIAVRYGKQNASVPLWPQYQFQRLVGRSRAMRELFAQLSKVALLDASVLIFGETGTGKELVARSIHDASNRANGPFVVVDCAALPETLLDAELFGHTKGAFTGADTARVGAIESANGGTVFLDEIGELPVSMQPKLLRALESRTVRRIGESHHRQVDVRFLSATHRDLLTMVNAGEFREDLYFRLAVVPITVPPLRSRPDDIEVLVEHFLPKGAGRPNPELLRELRQRPWRGNARELRNFVERALALGSTEALAMTAGAKSETEPPPSEDGSLSNRIHTLDFDFEQSLRDFREQWLDVGERRYLRLLLARHDRNVAAAAREAGVDRTYIYRLIRKHGL